jgi:hypothetical protein
VWCSGASVALQGCSVWELTLATRVYLLRLCVVCAGERMAVDAVSSMLAGVTNNVSQQADYPPAVSKKTDAAPPRAISRQRRGERERQCARCTAERSRLRNGSHSRTMVGYV